MSKRVCRNANNNICIAPRS